MRTSLLIAAALMLCGCGKKDSTEQTANTTTGVTAESFAGSDTTAIDAATGADANMAADVEYNDEALDALMNQDVDGEDAQANAD